MNKYEVMGLLGEGGYAKVLLVKDKDGQEFALKKPFHPKAHLKVSTGVINMKELYIMACVKHPYIQGALVVFFEDPCPIDRTFVAVDKDYDRMFFLMTKARYTCHELVHTYKAKISHIKRAMWQIICAVYYLHTEGICHRDLKPGNFLCYYNDGVLTTKLTDFGMTKPMNYVNKNSLHAGTAYYRAPELILKNMDYGFSMDIWSLGCSFFEMVSRRMLFKADDDLGLLQLIFTKRGSPDAQTMKKISRTDLKITMGNHKAKSIKTLLNLSPTDRQLFDMEVVENLYNPGSLDQFCNLLDKMLVIDPDRRINIMQVIQHPFFSGFFKPHKLDFDIWRPTFEPKQIPMQIFPSNHRHWKIGADAFINMDPNRVKYDDEVLYSIRFHGLDLYSRFLLKSDPVKDKTLYKKLAWSSGYIMSKFFLDEASDHMWDIFPESYTGMTIEEIIKIERLILQTLEFEIYRPTCFTHLKYRSFYAALFALMLKDNLMFGRPIEEIMKIVNSDIARLLKEGSSNP